MFDDNPFPKYPIGHPKEGQVRKNYDDFPIDIF